ncbi:hypothetical protein FRC18_009439 [Serendipita sp. 400]|nr:hypothetical protein FRC18_009439 [Serendipita sp. 400]
MSVRSSILRIPCAFVVHSSSLVSGHSASLILTHACPCAGLYTQRIDRHDRFKHMHMHMHTLSRLFTREEKRGTLSSKPLRPRPPSTRSQTSTTRPDHNEFHKRKSSG